MISKFPVIILDGPDATGKTTFASKIKARYIHSRYCKPNKTWSYHMAIAELALKWSTTSPVVIDRWWPSEMIYSKTFRDGSLIPSARFYLDRIALKHGWSYVFTIPKNKKRYLEFFNKVRNERKELYDDVSILYDNYLKLFDHMKNQANVHRYDLFNDSINPIMSSVYDYFQTRNIIGLRIDHRECSGNMTNPDTMLIVAPPVVTTRRKLWPCSTEYSELNKVLSALNVDHEHSIVTTESFAKNMLKVLKFSHKIKIFHH